MAATTWNPDDRTDRIVLSNSDLTVESVSETVGHAVDMNTGKYWAWNPVIQKWNNDVIANEDPAAGLGGLDITYITGDIYPIWNSYIVAATNYGLINTGASPMCSLVPAGFTTLDAAVGSPVTWNPSDKSADIALSGSDYKASHSSGINGTWASVRATNPIPAASKVFWEVANNCDLSIFFYSSGIANLTESLSVWLGSTLNSLGWLANNGAIYKNNVSSYGSGGIYGRASYGMVRATNSKSTRKYLFEVTCTTVTVTGAVGPNLIGLATASADKFNYSGSDNFGVGFSADGRSLIGGANVAPAITPYTSGESVLIAVDFGLGRAWGYTSGSSKWLDDVITNQNPQLGIGGKDISGLGTPLFPTFSVFDQQAFATANFAGPFVNAAAAAACPSFVPWDSVAPTRPRRFGVAA